MRVLVLHNRYALPGGEDAVVDEECALLERHGHAVERLFADNAGLSSRGLAGARLAANTVWSRSSAERVQTAIARFQPDLMHVHNTLPQLSPSVYSAARAFGLPIVQTLHNFRLLCPNGLLFRDGSACHACLGKPLPWPSIVHACYRDSRAQTSLVAATLTAQRLARTWVQAVDVFIALTEFARQLFASGGLPGERLAIKPNFLSHDPGQRIVAGDYCLYAGRLAPEKGVLTLLRAWSRMDAPPPLRIAGAGPMRNEVERAARRQPAITWLGQLSRAQVIEQLHGARLQIVPSECYENFPMSIVEAFACGVPVLATRVGGLPEIVEDDRKGWLVPPNDPDALARARPVTPRAAHSRSGIPQARNSTSY